MCVDPDTQTARAIVTPTAGQLTITEWMPDPQANLDTAIQTDPNGEWFEIRATADVDLNGLQAGGAALGTTPIVAPGGTCKEITAGSYALFARKSDPGVNGNLPAPDGLFTFGLTNGNGTLQIGFGGAALETRTWTSSAAGLSIQIDADGTQCNAPAATAPYYTNPNNQLTDRGTPRAVHTVECPPP
jgi:hypothetical protein